MIEIRIDQARPLREQPGVGHNRWHPDIPTAVRCDPGEDVILETRDGLDGQIQPGTQANALADLDEGVVHPLTGPIYVNGAKPGDLLEVEILDIETLLHGFTAQEPGFGLLRDYFPGAFLVHWAMDGRFATSPQLPGIRIAGAPFMGCMGVAPAPASLKEMLRRERIAAEAGDMVALPSAHGALPDTAAVRECGLRTYPPRENGGNLDMKLLTQGSRLFLPVEVPGALFSCGDGHFAQGDGEVCGTAIETGARLHARFRLHQDAARSSIRGPRLRGETPQPPPSQYFATTGIPVDRAGVTHCEDISAAARDAVLNMIEHLCHLGWTAEQAYVICSVAVDLKISQAVDLPNVMVTAVLDESIFAA